MAVTFPGRLALIAGLTVALAGIVIDNLAITCAGGVMVLAAIVHRMRR